MSYSGEGGREGEAVVGGLLQSLGKRLEDWISRILERGEEMHLVYLLP